MTLAVKVPLTKLPALPDPNAILANVVLNELFAVAVSEPTTAVAVTVAAPAALPALSTIDARPDELVNAVPEMGSSTPKISPPVPALTEKLTT